MLTKQSYVVLLFLFSLLSGCGPVPFSSIGFRAVSTEQIDLTEKETGGFDTKHTYSLTLYADNGQDAWVKLSGVGGLRVQVDGNPARETPLYIAYHYDIKNDVTPGKTYKVDISNGPESGTFSINQFHVDVKIPDQLYASKNEPFVVTFGKHPAAKANYVTIARGSSTNEPCASLKEETFQSNPDGTSTITYASSELLKKSITCRLEYRIWFEIKDESVSMNDTKKASVTRRFWYTKTIIVK